MINERPGKDYSISMAEANFKSIWFILPVLIVYLGLYGWLWGWDKWFEITELFLTRIELSLVLILAGIVAHEVLHAAAWSVFGNKPWSSFKFGFSLKGMAPYAHCAEPMPVGAYRLGVMAPGLILGIFPFVVGIIAGSGWITGFSFLFTLVAAGDFLMLWTIRKIEPPEVLVQDHPERVGCIVFTDQG